MTRKPLESEIKVGIFITLGTLLIMLAILVLGSTENILRRQSQYVVRFSDVQGLIPGAKVVLGGISVGTVDSIDFDREKQDIRVQLAVARKYGEWIRKDSQAEINTQGVLGDKFISITQGSAEEPALESGAEIPERPSAGLTQFLSKGDQLMVSLNGIAVSLDRLIKRFDTGGRSEIFFQGMANTARNMAEASAKLNRELEDVQLKRITRNLNAILEKINNGSGTLGALVNDPGLYDDAKALVGGANRSRIMRNLVRQTIKKSGKAEEEAVNPTPSPAPR